MIRSHHFLGGSFAKVAKLSETFPQHNSRAESLTKAKWPGPCDPGLFAAEALLPHAVPTPTLRTGAPAIRTPRSTPTGLDPRRPDLDPERRLQVAANPGEWNAAKLAPRRIRRTQRIPGGFGQPTISLLVLHASPSKLHRLHASKFSAKNRPQGGWKVEKLWPGCTFHRAEAQVRPVL